MNLFAIRYKEKGLFDRSLKKEIRKYLLRKQFEKKFFTVWKYYT